MKEEKERERRGGGGVVGKGLGTCREGVSLPEATPHLKPHMSTLLL